MPGGFDIAIQHICLTPLVYYEEYGRLSATHRFGADTVCRGTALAQLRGWWAFDVALCNMCSDYVVSFLDCDNLHAASSWVRHTVLISLEPWIGSDRLLRHRAGGLFGNDTDVPSSDGDSSMESDAIWWSTHMAEALDGNFARVKKKRLTMILSKHQLDVPSCWRKACVAISIAIVVRW